MLLSLWVLVLAFVIDVIYKAVRDYILIKKARVQITGKELLLDTRRIAAMKITGFARALASMVISFVVYLLLINQILTVNTQSIWFVIYYIIPLLAYNALTNIVSYIIGYIYIKFNTKAPK